jgi:hypothetical protein
MLLAALFATLAHAGEAQLQACCNAVGVQGCATTVPLYGEGSRAGASGGGAEVTGVWSLSCGRGATFDVVARRTLDHTPRQGELLEDVSPLAAHCFEQACELPPGACLVSDKDGRRALLGCRDGAPLGASALGVVPSPRMKKPVVVVIARRPLVVDAQPAAQAVPPPPPASIAAPGGAAAAAPRTQEALVELTERFPEDPATPCVSRTPELRAEARRHVDTGDEQRIARDWAGSVRSYRVALTMDSCNGNGWIGVGEVSSANQRPDLAARAFVNATALLPQHYGAWLSLGKAYEALGQVPLAAGAYRKALEISPSLMEARAGLARTGGG